MEKINTQLVNAHAISGPALVVINHLVNKVNELVDAVDKLSNQTADVASSIDAKDDGIHGTGGPYYEVVYKGEVVEKVKGKSKAEEAYEALLAAE